MQVALIFLELENTHQRYQLQLRAPLGLLYLKASLINKGCTVSILDQRISDFSINSLIKTIDKNKYDVIGFHVNSVNLKKTLRYVHELRKNFSEKIIVAGGPGSLHYNELLFNGCTAVLHGEGEERCPEVIECIENNRPLENIDGISYKDEKGNVVHREPLTLLDIDNLGMPYWDEHLISIYEDSFIPTLKKPSATMMASRGCIYNCTFCTTPGMLPERRYRVRKAGNVINEMRELKDRYNVRYITFKDDLFGIKQGWIYEFCERLIKEKLGINWFCALHPFSFRNEKEKVYSLLKKAGCDCIAFGTQSNSKIILKNINRHPDEPRELAKSLLLCRKLNIKTNTTYIFGLPGETRQTIKESIRFCVKSRPDLADFHELLILPGSYLAEKQVEKLPPFSKKEILSYCNKAMLQFYLNPKVLWNFITRILFGNMNFTGNFFGVVRACIFTVFSRIS